MIEPDSNIDSAPKPGTEKPHTGWHVVKVLIFLLLFGTAAIKATHLAEIVASDGLLNSKPLLFAVIAFEAAMAVYILNAPAWWGWLGAMSTFSVFTVVAAYALLTQTECHCLGQSLGGAKLTLPLDLGILFVSFVVRPSSSSQLRPAINQSAVLPLAAAVIFPVIAHYHNEYRTADEPHKVDMLLAEMLVGKEWPLAGRVHPRLAELETGRWLVLVVRSDCEHCRELIQQEFADPQRHRQGERTAVFIAGARKWPFQFDRVSFEVDQLDEVEWGGEEPFVASPGVFCIEDGIVTSAADGTESNKFLADLFSDLAE